MTDTTTPKKAGPRLQHVVAHVNENHVKHEGIFDDVVVFGQEIDALRHIIGKPDWLYVAVQHGQSFKDALKAARS